MHSFLASFLFLGLLAPSGVASVKAGDPVDGLVPSVFYHARNASSVRITRSPWGFLDLSPRSISTCSLSTDHLCPTGDGCCHSDEACCGSNYCCGDGYTCCSEDGGGTCAAIDGDCCADGSACDPGYTCTNKGASYSCSPGFSSGSGSGSSGSFGSGSSKPSPTFLGSGSGSGSGSGGSGSDGPGGSSVFTFTVSWDYDSYAWETGPTTMPDGQVTDVPQITSAKATTNTVVTITAEDSADASLSLGFVSAEVELSQPPEATTAFDSTPAAFEGLYTNGAGPGATGGPGALRSSASSLVGIRDVWALAVTVSLGLAAGVGIVLL